ncbi:phage tail sheath subtilisin-like domain-containing protein [Calothrix sp. PCC 7507]|uniref:phage tail sheath family protein n=1 Tax=Calothrix sp. PCC 7507 TaxID=99598 RepID=UPI00029F31D4|nr:phage tail sheath subtilisin-like domain-containing protein [Calothrix sp. PCC 7507]AFY33607.1 phage tail sheath protein fi-like protein [Calothrix sp. PCC 7507]
MVTELKIPKIPGVSLTSIVPTPESELLTGVPVFFGLASLKPKPGETPTKKLTLASEPKKLTLATDFQQYFEQIKGYLGDAIKGFFENGGRLCYVIGLAGNSLNLNTLQKGLETSEVLENIDLVCVPDIMLGADGEIMQMQQAILEHCERMGDRFAILDAVNIADLNKLDEQRRGLTSRNGALYAPWLRVENRPKDIPPCGHIAGIYASCDRTIGVHVAPANIRLEGVLDLSFSLTPTEQQQLNPNPGAGVNIIRSLQGRGMRVWGVRTLSPIPEWQYVNVRRLFITFGRWANRNLADTVFEPNAFPLWVRLQRELSVYCESLWQQGALQGAVPEDAFYVKCDAQTNPPENREMGQVIAKVGLAPTIPGEFIQLLLVQSSSGITLT